MKNKKQCKHGLESSNRLRMLGALSREQILLMAILKVYADEIVGVTIKIERKKKIERVRSIGKKHIKMLEEANKFLFEGNELRDFCEFAGFDVSISFLRKYLKNYIKKYLKNSRDGMKNTKYARKYLFEVTGGQCK